MKRILVALSLVALGISVAIPAGAAAPVKSDSIVIRHQTWACHTWSLNGGSYKATLDVRLARGRSLTITNMDPMVHKLIQEAGPRVGMQTISHDHMRMFGLHKITGHGVMSHMGAAVNVTFPGTGVYGFKDKGSRRLPRADDDRRAQPPDAGGSRLLSELDRSTGRATKESGLLRRVSGSVSALPRASSPAHRGSRAIDDAARLVDRNESVPGGQDPVKTSPYFLRIGSAASSRCGGFIRPSH